MLTVFLRFSSIVRSFKTNQIFISVLALAQIRQYQLTKMMTCLLSNHNLIRFLDSVIRAFVNLITGREAEADFFNTPLQNRARVKINLAKAILV